MNSLSWLLFWADVLPQLASWLCFAAFFAFLGLMVSFILGVTDILGDASKVERLYDHTKGEYVFAEKTETSTYAMARRFQKIGYFAPLAFLLWGSSFLVPTKDTFYLIAASETGEQVLKTPEFEKIRKVINNYLDKTVAADESEGNSNEGNK